ncbi:MAG: 50S ribosomal protein L11 methyltransferase [Saprospiraceae bacterium]|nr:50S ribosomal protein L11 methyltransferase [Saprospiraceae bacterium]
MTWIIVSVQVAPETRDIALAFLGEYPFHAFEETDNGLVAYIGATSWSPSLEQELHALDGQYWTSFSVSELADQNWNALWESNFDPVDLSPFCVIRAIFHAPRPDVRFDLVIQPERAFGTGHHATTRMMVLGMKDIPLENSRVLDFGAGTAVLAILAAKLGARQSDAVEIEGPACISARTNVERNSVGDRVHIIEGDKTVIPEQRYDLILANINRHILVDSIPTLDEHLLSGGRIGLSGYLPQDCEILETTIQPFGWQLEDTQSDTGWISQWWIKPKQAL